MVDNDNYCKGFRGSSEGPCRGKTLLQILLVRYSFHIPTSYSVGKVGC